MTEQKSGQKAASETVAEISSCELMGQQKKLKIAHNGESYTLRITANNKLILTK